MGRILAIDYGQKRCGVAVTDLLQIIANGLDTVPTAQLETFLDDYVKKEPVDVIVVGKPKQMNNTDSESMRFIEPFVRRLRTKFPTIQVEFEDERFTSKMAFQSMIDGGLKKKDRQNKGLIDKVSATIILQSYLEGNKYKNR